MKEEDNIVVFRSESEFPIHRRKKAVGCTCDSVGDKWSHGGTTPGVFIDESTRMVECRKCGAQLDPFDFLWHLATKGHSLNNDIARMAEDVRLKKAQLSLLEDEIKSLKSERNKAKRTA